MKCDFILDGKDGSFDSETQIIKYNNRLIYGKLSDKEFIAKVNKAIRDSNPDMINNSLNIGCGYRPSNNAINLDYDSSVFPDIVRDVSEGLPFDSDKFEDVYSSHLIEHVKDVFFFIYEIWRVTKNQGKVKIIAPYAGYPEWAIQPDHVRMINYSFFDRWKPDHLSVQNEDKQTRGAKFTIIGRELINECREIVFDLEVIK